jgi:hypothetical protein
MVAVAANRIVAAMQGKRFLFWGRSMLEKAGDARSYDASKHAIPHRLPTSFPRPALISLLLLDFRPEAMNVRWRQFKHGSLFSHKRLNKATG